MRNIPKTPEQIHQDNLDRIARLRPIDDDFFRVLLKDNIPLAQFIIRTITGINDLVLTEEIVQYDIKQISGARSVCFDVFGTDSEGRRYDIEVQRADNGATPKRARYHSSVMDMEFLKTGEDFENLPITYTIFITENDVRGENRAKYHYGMTDLSTGRPLNDGTNVIFANAAYNNENDKSDVAKLLHDFKCSNADEMNFDIMSDKVRQYKINQKGASDMCKIMEEIRTEALVQVAYNLLKDGVPEEVVAKNCNFSLEDVRELAEQVREENPPKS